MIRVFEKGQPLDLPLPAGKRVAIKPNLTFPIYKEGVTTSPAVLESVIVELVARDNEVNVIESDGGYGAWECERALLGHGIYEICERHGAHAVNLTKAEQVFLTLQCGRRRVKIPYPKMLQDSIDVFISMPVPKVHCMTGVSLAMKNQWGVIPDPMRLEYHYLFNEAILEINRRLPSPIVIADGTYFLDGNGPMEGTPLRKGLIITADTIGEFDRYMCAMMGVETNRVPHLRHAIRSGFVPETLDAIEFDSEQLRRLSYRSGLHRTPRNWLVLTFFHSKHLTRLIYTSPFGRALHRIFYAVVGRPTAS